MASSARSLAAYFLSASDRTISNSRNAHHHAATTVQVRAECATAACLLIEERHRRRPRPELPFTTFPPPAPYPYPYSFSVFVRLWPPVPAAARPRLSAVCPVPRSPRRALLPPRPARLGRFFRPRSSAAPRAAPTPGFPAAGPCARSPRSFFSPPPPSARLPATAPVAAAACALRSAPTPVVRPARSAWPRRATSASGSRSPGRRSSSPTPSASC
mmetsp:Transcript_19711/g.49481  ORF Transcript_19711/g.49481 Transcript_19711/m.49481 type:complete len:215 (+) Transcript_19711:421-1065(+)